MQPYSLLIIACSLMISPSVYSTAPDQKQLQHTVDTVIRPLMQEHRIPGMVIAVTFKGQQYFYPYGIAEKESGTQVTPETIFELGSISKTFAATLASYAQVTGALCLQHPASQYVPALAGSSFDKITPLQLGTYTAGGLPLQFPDDVNTQEQMVAYYQNWRPASPAGTYRQYSNPSLGLFGYLAAQSLKGQYTALVEENIFAGLGLNQTYFTVPKEKMQHYAYGYSKEDKPVRVSPGILDAEAYGVKSSAEDMLNYVEANIQASRAQQPEEPLQKAIKATHAGYFSAGEMIQGLGWEQYIYPVTLEHLTAGNSANMAYQANPVTAFTPPQPPSANRLINKTGSTNGFGAYIAFIPEKQLGIVMLANKNYPNEIRVKAAYQILTALESNN